MTETQLIALMAASIYAAWVNNPERHTFSTYSAAVDEAVTLHRAVQHALPESRCFRDGSVDGNCVPVLSTEAGWGNT